MADDVERLELLVDEDFDRERLDRFVAAKVEGLSRARAQDLIRNGLVAGAGGTLVDSSGRVKLGDRITVCLPPPVAAEPVPEAMALDIVYEDGEVIVLDKPAGLVVHPAAGHAQGTLVNALLAHCGDSLSGIGGVKRPGIVHRLDKDTSGLMVVAKTDRAHKALADQFAAHGADGRLERTYVAVAWGVPARNRGSVDAPLGRSNTNRTRIAIDRSSTGRRAVSHYEVLECFDAPDGRAVASLCRVTLETGRTHQIRVHFAYIGHPLLGDSVYGAGYAASRRRLGGGANSALERLGRQALHAAAIGFVHPVTGEKLRFEASLPIEMQALIEALRQDAGDG
ncbi:MAG: hypothetical protein RLZ98_1791 [Pseudomonadota bacterium]|jgi:23S rRNA pseudouridine1911/1915/1917 synthase